MYDFPQTTEEESAHWEREQRPAVSVSKQFSNCEENIKCHKSP